MDLEYAEATLIENYKIIKYYETLLEIHRVISGSM